jgi:cell wall-associated NlpC family hydrolase
VKASEEYASLIGIPYKTLDCWGIVREFYRLVFKVELKRYYEEIPNDRDVAKNLIYTNMGEFSLIEGLPKFGDIALIRLFGIESHIAVYIDKGKILHTSINNGCHIDSLKKWEKLVVGFYRVKND